MDGRATFAQHVKEALANFYSSVHLQTSPLAAWLSLESASGETTATQLRDHLRQAIETLRPPTSVPLSSPEWMGYRVLWLRYVQSKSRYAICEELGYSQASYYRHHQEALDALISVLWEQAQQKTARQISTASLDPDAVKEAMRLARNTQREPVPLAEVLEGIRETIRPLTEAWDLPLHIEAPIALPSAYGDLSVFRQIVLNLLTEAIKHTKEGLCLCVERQGDETVWRIQGITTDTGVEEVLQAANGLIVSNGLLTVYGGRLWIEQDEHGSPVLTFVLPIARPGCVLIIDDDEDTIDLYSRYLQDHDYAVLTARTRERLEGQLAETKPDLILLDVLMPRWDGWMVLQQLRMIPETANIPVIIVSVLSQPALALAQGAVDVLQKPISEQALLRAIRAVLGPADSQG